MRAFSLRGRRFPRPHHRQLSLDHLHQLEIVGPTRRRRAGRAGWSLAGPDRIPADTETAGFAAICPTRRRILDRDNDWGLRASRRVADGGSPVQTEALISGAARQGDCGRAQHHNVLGVGRWLYASPSRKIDARFLMRAALGATRAASTSIDATATFNVEGKNLIADGKSLTRAGAG